MIDRDGLDRAPLRNDPQNSLSDDEQVHLFVDHVPCQHIAWLSWNGNAKRRDTTPATQKRAAWASRNVRLMVDVHHSMASHSISIKTAATTTTTTFQHRFRSMVDDVRSHPGTTAETELVSRVWVTIRMGSSSSSVLSSTDTRRVDRGHGHLTGPTL